MGVCMSTRTSEIHQQQQQQQQLSRDDVRSKRSTVAAVCGSELSSVCSIPLEYNNPITTSHSSNSNNHRNRNSHSSNRNSMQNFLNAQYKELPPRQQSIQSDSESTTPHSEDEGSPISIVLSDNHNRKKVSSNIVLHSDDYPLSPNSRSLKKRLHHTPEREDEYSGMPSTTDVPFSRRAFIDALFERSGDILTPKLMPRRSQRFKFSSSISPIHSTTSSHNYNNSNNNSLEVPSQNFIVEQITDEETGEIFRIRSSPLIQQSEMMDDTVLFDQEMCSNYSDNHSQQQQELDDTPISKFESINTTEFINNNNTNNNNNNNNSCDSNCILYNIDPIDFYIELDQFRFGLQDESYQEYSYFDQRSDKKLYKEYVETKGPKYEYLVKLFKKQSKYHDEKRNGIELPPISTNPLVNIFRRDENLR